MRLETLPTVQNSKNRQALIPVPLAQFAILLGKPSDRLTNTKGGARIVIFRGPSSESGKPGWRNSGPLVGPEPGEPGSVKTLPKPRLF
jgi:hypothetical protein